MSATKTLRIDAHQHYWRYDARIDDWIDPTGPIARDFVPSDVSADMAAAGIDAAVAVQARSSEADTAFLLDLARRGDRIAGVVGWLDLAAGDLDERIERVRRQGPLVGLRHIVQAEPDGFLQRGAIRRGIATTLAAGLAYDILVVPRQLRDVIALLERVGEGRLVLDHGAKPPIAAGEWQPWADELAAAAQFPQLVCKVSGLVTEADHRAWRPAQIERYLDHLLRCFGADRLLFGSDWPVCTLAATYGEVHALVADWVATRCPEAADAIFGGNAARTYGLAGTAARP